MAKAKRADLYGQGDELPRCYPWEMRTPVVVAREWRIADNGIDIEEVYLRVNSSGADEFWAKPDEIMNMPRRPRGETKIHPYNVSPDLLAYGDQIPNPADSDQPYIVLGMRPHTPSNTTRVIVRLMNSVTREEVQSIGEANIEFVPGRQPYKQRTAPLERKANPLRGPYEDVNEPGVIYWLSVHPTGRGRWPNSIPHWSGKVTPGEYTSRPIAVADNDWKRLKFIGEDSTNRHPNDPEKLRLERSKAWEQYKRSPF